jgi:hypothetical protein
MTLLVSDLVFVLSGGFSNGDPAKSLGGEPSTTDVREVGDLFPDIGPDASLNGLVDHRCVYFFMGGPDALEYPKVFIPVSPTYSVLEVGIDPAGKNRDAQSIGAGEEPEGVIFARADDYANGLMLPAEPYDDGDYVALWIRRTVPPKSPSGHETFKLRVRGMTV